MALLGSTVDPRLFVQDYSGFTRAADIQAQSMANLGSQIAGGIERYGEQKQERKKLDAGIKATVTGIESAIKMGESLGIDVKSSLTPYLDKINDPNVSPIEAAAYAKEASNTISNVLNFGMKANEIGLEKERYSQASAARIAELQSSKWQPYDKEIAIDGQKVKVTGSVDQFGQFKDINNNVYSSVADAFAPAGQTEQPLPGEAYPDGIPTAGTPIDGPSVLPPDKQNKVPEPPVNFDFNQFPSVPGDAKVTPEVVANIEAAGGVPVAKQTAFRLPPGASIVTDKTKGTFRAATLEESQQRGAVAGQINTETNQFFPINPPPGMTIESDGKGGFKMTQGSGVGGAGAKAEAAKNAVQNKIDKAIALTQDLNLLEDRMQSMSPGVLGAAGRAAAEQIPGTFQAENKEIIDRVVATLTLENLQAMRNNNPTGAALGNVSDKDTSLVRDSATSLRNAQTPESFKKELVRLRNLQHDVVYGSERVLKDKLSKGEIDKSQFDAAMAAAPSEYLNDRGVITTRPTIPAASGSKVGLDQGTQDVLNEFLHR